VFGTKRDGLAQVWPQDSALSHVGRDPTRRTLKTTSSIIEGYEI